MRFRAARDDCDLRRVPDPLPDLVVADRCDTAGFALRPERARVLRCLATDFLRGRPLRGGFGLFIRLRTLRVVAGEIGRRFSAAFPVIAPTTPPITAPIGPATLPAAAPATAPTVCLGIGGISMFFDEVSSFFAFGFLGITVEVFNPFSWAYIISNAEEDLAVTILKPIGGPYPNAGKLSPARNQLQVR
jgi:hypothetical protein